MAVLALDFLGFYSGNDNGSFYTVNTLLASNRAEHVVSLKASANLSLTLLFLLLLALHAECHWPCSVLGGAGRRCGRCWLQLRQQQADQGQALKARA